MRLCSFFTRFLAVHSVAFLLAIALAIVGSRLASQHVDDANCAGSNEEGDMDRKAINKWALIVAVPALISGICSAVGVCLGTGGVWKERRIILYTGMALLGLAILCAAISMAAGIFANFNGCGDYRCSGSLCCRLTTVQAESTAAATSGENAEPTEIGGEFIEGGSTQECCDSTDCKPAYICREEYDSFCEYDTKNLPVFFVALVTAICLSVACCHACWARATFTEAHGHVLGSNPSAEVVGN